jgi:D-alanine-D-alanine ligase
MKPIIAVIFGGTSPEHEISLLSAMQVIENIDHERYDILQIGISKQGAMYVGPSVLLSLRHNQNIDHLTQCSISTNINFPGVFILTKDGSHAFQKVDLFFPLVHGMHGEDGTLQGALECLKIPYSGSGVMASSIAIDKHRTKLIWQALGLPVAKWQYLTERDYRRGNFKLQLQLPIIVKPVREGSTIGITKLHTLDKLEMAIELAFKSDTALLIEELIIGDEFTATVFNNKVYPIVKIEAPNEDYDYKNKKSNHFC